METRKCRICGEVKPLSDYYVHKGWRDTKCKECAIEYSRKYQREHSEEKRAYRKKYYEEHKEQSKARNKIWVENNREAHKQHCRESNKRHRDRINRYNKEYKTKHPEKRKANGVISSKLQRGKIEKPNKCSICGREGYIEAHHDDYLKPLEVIWCCKFCHHKLDEERRNREACERS